MVPAPKVRSGQTVGIPSGFPCLLLLAMVLAANVASAAIVERVPRVLILYPLDERTPAPVIVGESARNRLLDVTTGKIDLFSEFLDLTRFSDKIHIDRMARYLAAKYVDYRPDVVIAIAEPAANFIVAHRSTIAPNARIVFSGFGSDTAARMKLPSDVVGAFTEFDIAKTLQMARSLQPSARHLFIVGGSSEFDRSWLALARKELALLVKSYETTYLTDLTIDEFVERVARLPSESIVLFLTVSKDSTGRDLIPRDALERIAATASAPIYGPFSTYVGHGIVGGNTVTFESAGLAVADLTADAIGGKVIANVDVPQTYVADARQLKHWDLSESRLPPGTVQSFKEKTLWEEHQRLIIAILVVLALQGLVIGGLLVERRRRHGAEQEARRRLLEVVHLNQSATAGALSASIAHELNQPLGAIRANAEAAEVMIRGKTPDLKLIQQILCDIRDDDQRAEDIIVRLRGLLKKRSEIDWQEFDLKDVIKSSIQILHAEAGRRNITISFSQPVAQLPVRADQVHVQQVILNLATNAMDAMLDAVSTERRLVFQTTLTEGSEVELSISDTGRGIPSGQLARVFDAFYTTKATGTGLGLSIARTIIETYGGKIWADNRADGGAVFRFVLPLAQRG
ncbi:sensor histidine kinase [Rhizobium sp. WYCCWR 11152]|nr:sensor histidine kinase [Rhizobium sp. WYCCWR 11152]